MYDFLIINNKFVGFFGFVHLISHYSRTSSLIVYHCNTGTINPINWGKLSEFNYAYTEETMHYIIIYYNY